MCFLVNTAGPVPLSPSVHKRSQRLQGKEVCRWVVHVCLWASGPRHCYCAHVGAAESICADPWRRWSDHSKGAKKGSLVITSIYNPLLSLESVSPRRCARIETCQLSQMICVGVREELFEHFQGDGVRQKLRDRLGDLCELWLRLGQPLEVFSPGQPSIWQPWGFFCQTLNANAVYHMAGLSWRHLLRLLSTFSSFNGYYL